MGGHKAPAAALARLEKKLANDTCAILTNTEIRVLDREVRRVLVSSFPGIEAHLTHSEDSLAGARRAMPTSPRRTRDW